MKKVLLLLFVGSLAACNDKPKSVVNTAVIADTLPVSASTRAIKDSLPTDSLVIHVDSTGTIRLGNKKISLDELEDKLVDSMRIIKKNYSKLPDTILLRTNGDVLMGTRGAIKDMIMDAKDKVKSNK